MGLLQERMRQPLHLGVPEGADRSGAVGNPACGDVLTFHLRVEGERIMAAGFESMGSAYGLAAADVLCDRIVGSTLEEATACGPECILDRLPDMPARHRYLARLATEALRRALHGTRHVPTASNADVDGMRSFVRRILGNGQAWTTPEIEAMAEAEALRFPDAPARFLAAMCDAGIIQCTMDVARRAMVWRLAPR